MAHPCRDMVKELKLDCNMVMLATPCRDTEEFCYNMVILVHPCRDMEKELNCNIVMLAKLAPEGTWWRSSTVT